ncbi:MAG TPA: DoxX family protein [Burkholderiales bacterium]|jgi:putative oxidoreductase|nr:DoxX family protein [Burkholderiales bacterium]
MLLFTRDDFRIRAENFDLTKGANIVRIAAGAFMFPHVAGKFAAIGSLTLKAGTVGFFAKAGMTPPEFWVYLAATSELMVGIFLVLGLCTRYAALGGAAVLGIAVYALQTVKGFSGWTWNTGGYEYPVFWALVCAAIALEEFKALRGAERRAIALSGTPRLAT